MKRKLAIFILLIWMLPVCARAADYLVPVGTLVGLQLRTDTITVAAFDEASGSAARDAGLKIGDCITAVNGTPAQSIDQIKDLLQKSTAPVVLSVTRGSRRLTLHLTPRQTESGAVLGVYLRQGISGIGTVTWYDPETKQFAALGHGVSTGKEGLFRLVSGEIYPAEVFSVQKGTSGTLPRPHRCAQRQHAPGDFRDNQHRLLRLRRPRRAMGCPAYRPRHHSRHRPPGPAAGVFCGNSENISQRPHNPQKFSPESHRPGPDKSNRRYRTGNVRFANLAGRQTHRRRNPCFGK